MIRSVGRGLVLPGAFLLVAVAAALLAWRGLGSAALREGATPDRDGGAGAKGAAELQAVTADAEPVRRPTADRPAVAPESAGQSEPVEAAPPAAADLAHAAVQALADFHGADPAEVVAEIEEVWPELLELEVAPLGDWAEVAATLPEELSGEAFGHTPEENDYYFEAQILGDGLDEHVGGQLGEEVDELLRSDRLWECRAALQPYRQLFDDYRREFDSALRVKLTRGEFDRSPYVQLNGFRKHTNVAGKRTNMALGTAFGDSCWSVVVEFHDGDFPGLEDAKRRWLAARERAAEEVARILGG
ncbi:MAG: hypothetical protein AAF682_17835 [Planctomycetota bacterium]